MAFGWQRPALMRRPRSDLVSGPEGSHLAFFIPLHAAAVLLSPPMPLSYAAAEGCGFAVASFTEDFATLNPIAAFIWPFWKASARLSHFDPVERK